MTRLLALVDRVADLALHFLAGFAAAALAEPEWTPEALDRLLDAVRQEEDFELWEADL